MIAWLILSTLALAESPGTLPGGSKVIYAGGGLTTFNALEQGGEAQVRDRELRFRGDVYGALGLSDRFQVSASVPLVYSSIIDNPDEMPCPNVLASEGYCDSYVTVGQARLEGRAALVQSKLKLTTGVAADVDNHNAGRRGQFNSAGSGRTVLEGFAVAGSGVPVGDWRLRGLVVGGYGQSLAEEVSSRTGDTVKAMGNHVRGSVELRAKTPGPVAFEVGAHGFRRLSGVDLDGAWVSEWFLITQDRWNVLAYRQVAGSAKPSIDLPRNQGLHLGVMRVLSVENGPTNTTDVALGWHRYFAP